MGLDPLIAEWVGSTLSRALVFGTPLLLAALGEIYAERAGVVNLGVDGMMTLGAFFAFAVAYVSGSPELGLLVAAAVGGLAALLHAIMAVTLRANQYVSGLALGMFGLGLAGLLGRGWEGIPLEHSLPELSTVTYLALALAGVLWGVLYYTRWGIVLRSVGDAPEAADTMGINVFLVRYLAVIFGGVLAGLAGGYLSVAYRPSWTEGMTEGMGWIAIAIAIFAAWNPLNAIGGALLFGALFHLSFRLQTWVKPELLKMMPYAFTILALIFMAGGKARQRRGTPEALAVPYVRGAR